MNLLKKLALALVLCAAPCFAQNPQQFNSQGTLSATTANCNSQLINTTSCIVLPLQQGIASTTFAISGTFTGTLNFEVTVNGVTSTLAVFPQGGGGSTTSTTAPGTWQVGVVGSSTVQVRASALTSGTVNVTITSSMAALPNAVTAPVRLADGTASLPTYSFSNHTGTGLSESPNGAVYLSSDGSGVFSCTNEPGPSAQCNFIVGGFQLGAQGTSAVFISAVGNTGATTGGTWNAAAYLTATNCAANGTAANPSVVTCGTAAAGMFSCSATATGGTCTVNTTRVTANSEISITQDAADGGASQLNVTCNTANVLSTSAPLLAAKVAGTSFTINLGTVTTNPACFEYRIEN